MLRLLTSIAFTFCSVLAFATPYESDEWLTLLHYKGGKSLIDDERFFLSDDGKTDPASEYNATIKAFQSTNIETPDEHAICRYPARYEFIKQFENIKTPEVVCAEYESLKKTMNPQSISLIFPFLYVNRPASMFGHTLLRLNNSYKEPLLAHGITFLADASKQDNALVFSFKGLLGLYKGYFLVSKYYETVFQYTNIDKRDIWEYDLNFTRQESLKLFNHLWELKNIYTDYYFFDENCSYHLMFLLQSARPTLNLASKSKPWVIPSDSVKKVYDNNLVTKVTYRPSHSVVLNSIAASIPRQLIEVAKGVAADGDDIRLITESKYSDQLKASMLDLAIEYLRYENVSNKQSEEGAKAYREKTIEILTARSKYKVKADYSTETPLSPHLSHDSMRTKLNFGVKDNYFFTELGVRLAYHSLDDIDDGFIKNTQTEILGATIRFDDRNDNIYLQDVLLLSVGAYLSMNKLFKPISWSVIFAGERRLYKYDEKFVGYAAGSVGATFDFIGEGTIFTMAKVDVSTFYGVAVGGEVGYSIPYKFGKVLLNAEYLNYVFNKVAYSTAEAKVATTIKLSQNNAINLYYSRETAFSKYSTEIGASWFFYF